jgi:hypothetical protein
MMLVGDHCLECVSSPTGYCVKHTPEVTQVVDTDVHLGPECPMCKRVFEPSVEMCRLCVVTTGKARG